MGYASEGFLRRVEMKIQASKVPATLSNYPVFISELCLPQGNNEIFDADGTYPALADGGDIRCGEDILGATKMPIDLVEFTRDNDPANGTCEIHTKHSSVSSASDTSFWLFWSKAGASQPADADADGRDNVWDASFLGVWHLGDGDSTDADFYKDSTSNSNHGQLTDGDGDSTSITGKLGGASDGAFDFDGDGDYITTKDIVMESTDLYITGWVNIDGLADERSLAVKPDGAADAMIFEVLADGSVKFLTDDGLAGNTFKRTAAALVGINTWYHLAVRYDDSANDAVLYVDAAVKTNDQQDDVLRDITATADAFVIGARPGGPDDPMDGSIDEVRLSNTLRTANWLTAEFNNQSDPAAFILDQTPETTRIPAFMHHYTKNIGN